MNMTFLVLAVVVALIFPWDCNKQQTPPPKEPVSYSYKAPMKLNYTQEEIVALFFPNYELPAIIYYEPDGRTNGYTNGKKIWLSFGDIPNTVLLHEVCHVIARKKGLDYNSEVIPELAEAIALFKTNSELNEFTARGVLYERKYLKNYIKQFKDFFE